MCPVVFRKELIFHWGMSLFLRNQPSRPCFSRVFIKLLPVFLWVRLPPTACGGIYIGSKDQTPVFRLERQGPLLLCHLSDPSVTRFPVDSGNSEGGSHNPLLAQADCCVSFPGECCIEELSKMHPSLTVPSPS